jgi:hypothetical protein
MKYIFFVLTLAASLSAFGQKKSYPANVAKIENIRASYSGCNLGPCYGWWAIALKTPDELLMQHGVHHPAGARSRHFSAGTWKISGDTLNLSITQKALDTAFMRTQYRIVSLYDCEFLLPIDTNEDWRAVLKKIQTEFEQSQDYEDMLAFDNSDILISKLFYEYVRQEHSTDKKLLIKCIAR